MTAPTAASAFSRDDEANELAALYANTAFLGALGAFDATGRQPRLETAARYYQAAICVKTPAHIHASSFAGSNNRSCFAWRRFAFLIVDAGLGSEAQANALRTKLQAALGPPELTPLLRGDFGSALGRVTFDQWCNAANTPSDPR